MAYTRTYELFIYAGAGQSLQAQLKNTVGTNVGAAITTGFVDLGGGHYTWTSAAIPDSHRGAVVFALQSAPTAPLITIGINPEGVAENTNVKTSNVWDELIANHVIVGSFGALFRWLRGVFMGTRDCSVANTETVKDTDGTTLGSRTLTPSGGPFNKAAP